MIVHDGPIFQFMPESVTLCECMAGFCHMPDRNTTKLNLRGYILSDV